MGDVQREIEGVRSGEGLSPTSPSPVAVWGLPLDKILKFTPMQMQISAYQVKFLAFIVSRAYTQNNDSFNAAK